MSQENLNHDPLEEMKTRIESMNGLILKAKELKQAETDLIVQMKEVNDSAEYDEETKQNLINELNTKYHEAIENTAKVLSEWIDAVNRK